MEKIRLHPRQFGTIAKLKFRAKLIVYIRHSYVYITFMKNKLI